MKNVTKTNFTKLTQSRGVSLIVLIVTIIVVIILATAVILTISSNNPVESAREAKFKEDIRSFQDELAFSITKDYTNKSGQRDDKFNARTINEIKNYIPSFTKEYEEKLIIYNDEIQYVPENVNLKERNMLKEISIKPAPTAIDIKNNPKKFYGKIITNYTTGSTELDNALKEDGINWRIFHSDGNNVYIIADNYILTDLLPRGINNTEINKNVNTQYMAYFNDVLNDYPEGSEYITDNKIIELNKEFYNILIQNNIISTKPSIKAVDYMLDTNEKVWGKFAGNHAEYAIGGPTIELYAHSYNSVHDDKIEYTASEKGYRLKWQKDSEYSGIISDLDFYEGNIYGINSYEKAAGMWIASPWGENFIMLVFVSKRIGNDGFNQLNYSYGKNQGFRPVVCLKSNILLEKDGENYKIVENGI